MASFLEKLSNYLVTIANIFISLLKIILRSRFKTTFPEKKGNSIAFFANGPSLNQAIEKLKSQKNGLPYNIMVTNFFINSPEFNELKPNHYILCDPDFNFNGFTKVSYIKKFYIDLFAVEWEVNLFVPFSFKKSILQIKQILNIRKTNVNIFYYNDTNLVGKDSFTLKLIKMKLGISRPTTVSVPAIHMCMYLGYTDIIIGGIDLNQHLDIKVDKSNTLLIKSRHFYSNGEEVFEPWYKNSYSKETFKTSEAFLIFYRFFNSFDIIAIYAKKYKYTITNYSESSYLDQFKKI